MKQKPMQIWLSTWESIKAIAEAKKWTLIVTVDEIVRFYNEHAK